jgi:hypothetical protein
VRKLGEQLVIGPGRFHSDAATHRQALEKGE